MFHGNIFVFGSGSPQLGPLERQVCKEMLPKYLVRALWIVGDLGAPLGRPMFDRDQV